MVVILVLNLFDNNQYETIIRGKFGPSVTAQAKRQAWVKIAQQINTSFPPVARIRKECEKRGYVLQSKARKKKGDCESALIAYMVTLLMEGCDRPNSSLLHHWIFPVVKYLSVVVTFIAGV